MPERVPWTKSLTFKLGSVVVGLLAAALFLVLGNFHLLSTIRGDTASMDLAGKGRYRAYEMLYLCRRLFEVTGEDRAKVLGELHEAKSRTGERFKQLRDGDPALGIAPATDPRILSQISTRERLWEQEAKPLVDRVEGMTSKEEVQPVLASLDGLIRRYFATVEETVALYQTVSDEKVGRFDTMQYVFLGVVVSILFAVSLVARSVSGRSRALATTAERISSGELSLLAPVEGVDELAALGNAFNAMTANLRKMIESEKEGRAKLEKLLEASAETANSVSSASAEILAGTTQQASGAQEQAAAVTETVSTVDEVLQTSEQAAQRAKAVSETAQRATEVGKAGRKAVDETIAAMSSVKEQTESIAESILALAEKAQEIGEIIAAVNDIAEQVNLLALNASIEVSRAGEQGKGFAVVAVEIKALADQSKKATAQVRKILGEIQKATNSAVMVTEEGTKGSSAAIKVANQAGETIRALGEALGEAAQAAVQIVASAGQQATGMAQVHQAMRNISQVTNQNLASTRQSEKAVQDLNAQAGKLKQLMAGYGR